MKRVFLIFLIMASGLLFSTQQAMAISSQDLQSINNSTEYYAPSSGSCSSAATNSSALTSGMTSTQDQIENAETIIGIDKTENLGEQGALIGIADSDVEASLMELANSNVPLSEQNSNAQGIGSNLYSLGIFQQQITDNWSTISSNPNDPSTVNQLMTPSYNAEAFYGSPSGASNVSSALTKGVQNIANWQSLTPQTVAQEVEEPQLTGTSGAADYQAAVAKDIPYAQSLLDMYWSSTQPIPLPIPITGGVATGGSSSCSSSVQCNQSASTTTSSEGSTTTGQEVVCLAENELSLWNNGQIQPGPGTSMDSYFKYSQGRDEQWCADFVSWIYDQAGHPLTTQNGGNISWVPDIQQIGETGQGFTWHPINPSDPSTWYTPQPGDIAIHAGQHTNIVISTSGQNITLIGGDQGGQYHDSTGKVYNSSGAQHDTNIVSEYTATPATDPVPITGYVSPN